MLNIGLSFRPLLTALNSATIATQLQLSKLMRSVMSDIDPRRDASNFANAVPRYLRSSYNPPRTLYANYKLGECRDIMFGVGLADYAGAKGLVDGQIPKIVMICIQEVEKRGMNSEGIYRVSVLEHVSLDQTLSPT